MLQIKPVSRPEVMQNRKCFYIVLFVYIRALAPCVSRCFMHLRAVLKFRRSPSQLVRRGLSRLDDKDNKDTALSILNMIYGAIIVLFELPIQRKIISAAAEIEIFGPQ